MPRSRRIGRGSLCLLAVVVLALGAVNSWRSESSTGLLVVGGVILFFAVIGTDWDTMRFRHGDTEAELSRVRRAVKQVSEADSESELRGELETLEAELGARDEPAGANAVESWLARIFATRTPIGSPPKLDSRAWHTPRGNSMQLHYEHPDLETFAAMCEVTPPGREKGYRWIARKFEDSGRPPRRFALTFPDDFRGTPEDLLQTHPGRYRVTWQPQRLLAPETDDGGTHDAFEVPQDG